MAIFKRSHLFEDVPKKYFHHNPVNAFKHAWDLINTDETAQDENPSHN